MNRYFVSNYDRHLLLQIDEKEFKDFKQYNDLLKKYTNVFDCYRNYKKSEVLIKEYIEGIDNYEKDKFHEIYRDCKYLFMQNIMFGRVFIDNIKSYCNQQERFELKKEVVNFEDLDELKMLKLLRDYGQHFSLPFSNLTRSYSVMQEKTTAIKPLISVSGLRKNETSNTQNKIYLKNLSEGEISIVNYFEKWSKAIDGLLLKVKADFLLLTDLNIKQFVLSKILCFIGMKDCIPVGLTKADELDNRAGMYHAVEFIPFDEQALAYLFVPE